MPLDGLQLGHYQLQRLIGSGGMGEVYQTLDTRLFQREMRAIITLDHPHILPLYDFGEETINKATLTYMVMPYRKEGSLNDWLQQRSSVERLLPQDVGYLIQQAASALQHAHDRQVIHQDVKPSNFLVHSTNDYPSRPDLLLADFGVAKFTTATSNIS